MVGASGAVEVVPQAEPLKLVSTLSPFFALDWKQYSVPASNSITGIVPHVESVCH